MSGKKDKSKSKSSPLKRALIIFASVIFALAVIFAFFMICDAVAHSKARVVPDYAMDVEGLEDVLSKDKSGWTDEDYDFIYRQTGLTKVYFDSVSAVNETFILACQQDLFFNAEPSHDAANFGSSHDYFPDEYFHMAPLQAGDVLISASVHTFGWRNGHAALVLDPTTTVQAISIGTDSMLQTTAWFRRATNFLVLRPKISAEECRSIVAWAYENLIGVEYSLFTGIFNAKNQIDDVQTTQCAHLVWQAYMSAGYDIDSTGGPVVSPKNIANCDLFEVVQVNGFDLDALWS